MAMSSEAPLARPSPTIEDYLAVIYTLARDGESVIGRKLADWLEVSAPTVTETVQRMIRDGWVTMRENKTIHLTEEGRAAAMSVIRRHMLTELLLAKVLDVPWSKLHEEADRLEHVLSSDTTARLARVVDDPQVCPHGNPLPGYEDATNALEPLLDARPQCAYTLERIHEEVERNTRLMAFLERHGLTPGLPLVLVEVMPENETVTVHTRVGDVVLGLNVARRLWVKNAD
jgi:DtxR family Mn-dependent transcriptional regulator